MEKQRPYWKVIVSLAFSLVGTATFLIIGIKAIGFFAPLVVGWVISTVAYPLVCWLEKRLKIVKKLGSVIIIICVLVAVVGISYGAVSVIVREVRSLIQDFPVLYADLENGVRQIAAKMSGIAALLPDGVAEGILEFFTNIDEKVGDIIASIGEPTMTAAGNVAKRIPSILVSTIVAFLSAYFFIADREMVIAWAKRIFPGAIQKRMTMVIDNLKHAVGGYFKAQFKIMCIVAVMLFVGFSVLRVNFAVLLAILIAFLDFLPFFGTGTALIPWGIYKVLVGNYKMAIGLLIIYGLTQLVRQLIQPKLVGDSVGLNPLVTLILIYVGYKLGSVLGMIFSVPIGMIVINLYKAGAFDYILDDVKILVRGILSLRE